ncbi:MAG: DUF6291 domain-containing protein [bacterium]|jgi:hypothetical protein
MAENKNSFILYCDQKGVWDKLDNEQAGRLIKHIISYVNDENPTAPDFVTELAFEPIKQSLKRDLKKWEKQYDQRVEAGRKSAEVRKRNLTTVNERLISSTVSESVSVTDNVSVTVSVNERTLDWFKKQIDPIFLENLKMSQKGKDFDQAIKDSYAHMAADPARLARADASDCKKLLNTWLSNIKNNGNRNGFKTRANETVPTFSGDYSSKL